MPRTNGVASPLLLMVFGRTDPYSETPGLHTRPSLGADPAPAATLPRLSSTTSRPSAITAPAHASPSQLRSATSSHNTQPASNPSLATARGHRMALASVAPPLCLSRSTHRAVASAPIPHRRDGYLRTARGQRAGGLGFEPAAQELASGSRLVGACPADRQPRSCSAGGRPPSGSVSGEVEVRGEYLSAVEGEEERVAPAAGSRPVIDVLVRSGVVAEAGSAGRARLKGVAGVTGEGSTAGGLLPDVRDCAERADEIAARVPQLPLDRVGPAAFSGVDRRRAVHRREPATECVADLVRTAHEGRVTHSIGSAHRGGLRADG
jgi:hypothetical protein